MASWLIVVQFDQDGQTRQLSVGKVEVTTNGYICLEICLILRGFIKLSSFCT